MKVVLITGASSGMGKATAALLAQNGYIVYAAARRVEKMKALEMDGVRLIEMDIADDATMVTGVGQILKEQGRVDILINNAGFGSYGAIEDLSMEDARYQLEVNLIGAARLIQLVLPGMRAQQYGKIVNVTSIGGKIGMPFAGWYCASKYALEGLSDSLRMEVKELGIDVIVVEPGGISSEWNSIAMNSLQERSLDSAYKTKIEKYMRSVKKAVEAMKRSKKSDPIVIALLIRKGIEAKQPKTRYIDGYNAKMILGLRKLLSDKLFDKIMMSQL